MLKIKEMLASKKFKVMVFSILAIACSVMADKVTVSQGLENAVMIVMTYLGAQGLADFSKDKEKLKTENDKEGG